jgi:hypothetical protein
MFNKMALKTRRLFSISILLVSLLLGFMFYRALSINTIAPHSTLASQTLIQDAIRIIVTPLSTSPDAPLHFRINIESTEHAEWLDTNLKESAILYFDNNDPELPSDWLLETENDYSLQGTITFPSQKEINDLHLSLFLSSEFKFSW